MNSTRHRRRIKSQAKRSAASFVVHGRVIAFEFNLGS
jgi:hypothetical protein